MVQELLPGFADLLQDWILKKGPARAPQRITAVDIDDLARAAIETLQQRVTRDDGADWGSLAELTQGWLVQREKGHKPSQLGSEDFRRLVVLVLKNLSAPHNNETEEEGLVEVGGLAEKQEDPLRFARAHLARSL